MPPLYQLSSHLESALELDGFCAEVLEEDKIEVIVSMIEASFGFFKMKDEGFGANAT